MGAGRANRRVWRYRREESVRDADSADVTGRPIYLARSSQTCALGAAIAAAVVAGVYPDVPSAQNAMTGVRPGVFRPRPAANKVYRQLYKLYRVLHDAFGTSDGPALLYRVMKRLMKIRDRVRRP